MTVGSVAAAAVARRARVGARAARPDEQRAARIELGDRAAARADGVDVERREPHGVATDRSLGGRGGRAVEHQAHVGARAAHVEGDGVGEAVGDRHRRGGPDAARRTGQQQRGRQVGGVGDRAAARRRTSSRAPRRRRRRCRAGRRGSAVAARRSRRWSPCARTRAPPARPRAST